MKKKILGLFVLILVAICGATLCACGENEQDVSLSISSGLDSQLEQQTISKFSSELMLTELEQANLKNGLGYNGSVQNKNAVSLVVGSDSFSSREIVFEVQGAGDSKIYLSSDSSAISISSVESVGNGKYKATIYATSAGTAEVIATTGKHFKSTIFVVKSIEKPTGFSARQSTIYLERGKQLSLSPTELFSFNPSSTNLREVEFFDGEVSLTKDGKTVLSTEEGEGVTGVISESKEISARALRLSGNSSVQTLSIVVVEPIKSVLMKKLVYSDGEKTYSKFENGETLTSIRNVSAGEINYGVRELYVLVETNEKNLEINSKALLDGANVSLSERERITNENFETAKFKDLVDTSREEFSTWVFKFEFKYEGFKEYDVSILFNAGAYSFSETLDFRAEFKSASNLIEFKKVGDDEEKSEHTIYDSYSGTYGTKFNISTNTSDEISLAKLLLVCETKNIVVLDTFGKEKTLDELNAVSFRNNQTFYIKAKEGVVEKIKIKVCVSYTFENVEFKTEKEFVLNAVASPTAFVFEKAGSQLSSYVFDLNTSGKIISGINQTIAYEKRNTLTLSLKALVGKEKQTLSQDFTILSASQIAQVVQNSDGTISITALQTGTGSFKVAIGNGIENEFRFQVVKSVSNATASLPSENQSSSIISLLTNYSDSGTIYSQYAIAKKSAQIPVYFSAVGDISKIEFVSTAGVSFSNGKIVANKEFEKEEIAFKFSFNFVNESEEIEQKTVEIQKFLLTSIVQLENFEFTTNSGTRFELYNYSSVGFFNKNFATVSFFLDVWPNEIKEDILQNVVFSSNVSNEIFAQNDVDGTKVSTLSNDVFTLTYSNGVGTIFCDITNSETLEEFKNKDVVITAKISQSNSGEYSKTIQFSIKQATKVQLITSNVEEINLDEYSKFVQISVSTFPIDATNKKLIYQFVPNAIDGLYTTDIIIEENENGATIQLNNLDCAGGGYLRILAQDSFISTSSCTTYLEIPLEIGDGSEDHPYYINFASDLEKLYKTNFSKNYVISGTIDLNNKNLNYERDGGSVVPTLSGKINGKNNAKLKNISIENNFVVDPLNSFVYGGLFDSIDGGEIHDVSFEFSKCSFDVDEIGLSPDQLKNYSILVGSVAGSNRGGKIENASVEVCLEVQTGTNGYKLAVGGVVGQNSGYIQNKITKNNITNLFKGKICINDPSENFAHELYVGGVAGKNLGGQISRTVGEGLVEFNNAFATANVEITIETKNTATKNDEGIGGISGLNMYSTGIGDSEQKISGVSVVGKISAKNANNVGGIVGHNKSRNVEDCLSQAHVVGNENVGGAIGKLESGQISNVSVEHIETDSCGVLISGANNVGGIVGLLDGGTLKSSSFISYVTDAGVLDLEAKGAFGRIIGEYSEKKIEISKQTETTDDAETTKYVFEVQGVSYEIDNLETPKTLTILGGTKKINVNKDGSFKINEKNYFIQGGFVKKYIVDYVVAIADITDATAGAEAETEEKADAIEETEAKTEEKAEAIEETETDAENYAVYSRDSEFAKAFAGEAKINDKTSKTKQELQETEKFAFIFLPAGDINLELTEEGKGREMTANSENNDLAFYLFFYEGTNAEVNKNTSKITDLLSSSLLSSQTRYQRLNIVGDKPSILGIDGGNFVVKAEGVAKLTITSPYVKGKSQTIYIYVTRYTDSLSVYKDSVLHEVIGESETFDAKESKLVYFNFLGLNAKGYVAPQNTNVLFKITAGDETIVLKAGEEKKENVVFNLIKIASNCFQIAVRGEIGEHEVSIQPYFEFQVDEKTYSCELSETNFVVSVEFKFENTTKTINVSKDTIETEPYYETTIDVSLDSIKKDEKVKISAVDKDGNTSTDLEIVAKYGNESKTGDCFTMNCSADNKFTLTVKMKEKSRNFSETKNYYVKITTTNGLEKIIKLIYKPQSLISISSTLYPAISEDQKIYNFDGSFSYIPSGAIVPGQHSLIELALTPSFASFETIEIYNSVLNEIPLVFDLFDRSENAVLLGATITENGIKIPSKLIKNGIFSIRTFADQRLSDNSTTTIYIVLKDKNGNQVGQTIEKTFYIEHLPGVSISIDGVSSGNETPLKLAKGIEYDIYLWIKGYYRGAYANTGSIVTDGQVVLEIEGQNLATIARDSSGSYKLVVSSNDLGENRTVKIKTYGINSKGEKSKECVLTIEIVEFIVKTDDLGDIISGSVNGIYSSATGNSLDLEISLNSNILIYNLKDVSVVEKVRTFLNSLSTGKIGGNSINVWQYRDFGESSQNHRNISSNLITKSGAFEVKVEDDGKVVVFFKKPESSSVPTFGVFYNAKFFYDKNGLPTLFVNQSEAETYNLFTLNQNLNFDISEKTSLRNPYPITSASQLEDLREGNFYILMNDITLPEDFAPISTKIGGFDGNNHRIVLSNLNKKAGESKTCYFGLFETTAQDALIKNVILYASGNVDINLYDYTTVIAGLLVGENNGKITNCSIERAKTSAISFNIFGNATSSSVLNTVGGLVGVNNGDITNSRVQVPFLVNATASSEKGCLPANVGGISGINKGNASIASSFVSARVENNTAGSLTALTGGITSQNEVGAKIFATYISGETTFPDESELQNATEIVYSTASAGAFVHTNSGTISNCFANIPVKANVGASGFVYRNLKQGLISYCYSTSALDSSARNSSFIGVLPGVSQDEDPILNKGLLEECYSWEEQTGVNSGFASNGDIDGLVVCKKGKFSKTDTTGTFKKFAFTNTVSKADGVWFWANSGTEPEFLNGGIQMKFSTEAPQLVSPNLIATGSQSLISERYDQETQNTIYTYAFSGDQSKYQEGSKYNPYVIASQDDLEFLVSKNSGFTNGFIIGEIYCRLVGDIIYETSTVSSGLFQYSFLGNLEGNSYTIGNYVLDSSIASQNGGFFATIGTMSNQIGTIKNLTFAPRYMSLTNCNSVGAVAGSIYGATLVNIVVDGTSYSSNGTGVTIIGKNIVGGLVGKAEGAFSLNNISSTISVNATYRASLNYHEVGKYLIASTSKISYAGVIAGTTNGYGNATRLYVQGNIASIAENAGLMFGYVGKNVVVENLYITGSINQIIKADIYGGVVSAQNKGSISNVEINGANIAGFGGFFDNSVCSPIALGNIVGLMEGGAIKNARAYATIKAKIAVESLGGAVGEMTAGMLEEIIIVGDLSGGNRIGGIVGKISNYENSTITIKNVFHSGNMTSNSSSEIVTIGTIVGVVSGKEEDVEKGDSKAKIRVWELNKENDFVKSYVIDEGYVVEENGSLKAKNLPKISITTFATSSLTDVWAVQICVEDNTNTRYGISIDDVFGIYEDIDTYVPLASSWKLNGVDQTLLTE